MQALVHITFCIIIAFIIAFVMIAGCIWKENRVQKAFERKAKKDWDAMSEKEKKESGMDNMYC